MFIAAIFISTVASHPTEGLVLFILNFVIEYLRYESHVEFLHKKGLTAKQYRDQQFIIKWKETQQEGLIKYCLFDGGLIAGSILSIFIGASLLFSKILGDVTNGPGSLFSLIWKSFIIGFMIAACIYRILWIYQEKRYHRLTTLSTSQNFSTSIPSAKPFR
jgi:hypothetical protein